MSDVKTLRVVSETLLQFAKGLDSVAIPKLTFQLEHEPADLPGVSVPWKVSVKLVGLKDIKEEDGSRTNSYEKSWEGSGESPEEAAMEMLKTLRQSLSAETQQKTNELNSLQSAISSMNMSVDMADLWPKTDSHLDAPNGGSSGIISRRGLPPAPT